MISWICRKIANYVARKIPDTDPEILAYGYELLLQDASALLAALLSSLLLRQFFPMLVAVSAYAAMRYFAGGAHAPTRLICGISYLGLLYGSILVSRVLPYGPFLNGGLYLFSLILLLLYAPAATAETLFLTDVGKKKAIVITILTALHGLAFLVGTWSLFYANLLVVIPAVISAMTHPLAYRVYKCEPYQQEGMTA